MELSLDGKVAIVTGAASRQGIGSAIALALANEGANIALADIDFDGVKDLTEDIKKMGRKSLAFEVDQGSYSQVQEAVVSIHKEMGAVDILVNNAALTSVSPGSTNKVSPSDWEKEINVSLNGVFYWTREVLPLMTENGWGRVINISSLAGVIGAPGLPCYSACKGAVIAFTKSVAIEVAKKGITINALSLGFIKTGIYSKGLAGPETIEAITDSLPMGRMGSPEEVANLVTFLVSDKAAYIHGTNMVIDGGLTVGITRPSQG